MEVLVLTLFGLSFILHHVSLHYRLNDMEDKLDSAIRHAGKIGDKIVKEISILEYSVNCANTTLDTILDDMCETDKGGCMADFDKEAE